MSTLSCPYEEYALFLVSEQLPACVEILVLSPQRVHVGEIENTTVPASRPGGPFAKSADLPLCSSVRTELRQCGFCLSSTGNGRT